MRLMKLLLVFCIMHAASACGFDQAYYAAPVAASQPAPAPRPRDEALIAYKSGDYATALRLWRPLAEQGDANAQGNLGFMYERGQGVPQDYAAAVPWYRKAADQGHAKAQSNLGAMYERGQGVPQDYAAAVTWYRKAADQGNAGAQGNLGAMYERGIGVPQDYAAAVAWYRKAADQGLARAQNNLGAMYAKGQGVTQNYAAAVSWYRKAADQGNATAQGNLGVMYANGRGVPQDYAAAASWYRKAADQGNGAAQKNLTDLLTKAPDIASRSAPTTPTQRGTSGSEIPMKKSGGTYVVPVLINNVITLDFVVDSGASDVSIPEDVVITLMRAKTIRDTDFVGQQTYVLADGSKVKSHVFRIRSLKVGDRVIENVTGSVAGRNGSLLLGQSFLGRFKSWSVDNTKHALVLE